MRSSGFLWRPSPPSLSGCAVQLELTPPPLHHKHAPRTQQTHTLHTAAVMTGSQMGTWPKTTQKWTIPGLQLQKHQRRHCPPAGILDENTADAGAALWGWFPGTRRSMEPETTPGRAQQGPWLSSLLNSKCKWTFCLPLREGCLPLVPKGPFLCHGARKYFTLG